MGSKNKHEFDKESGLLRLDWVLFSAVHCPADYGFVPRSFYDDGDLLDAFVPGQEPVVPLTIMTARAIGPTPKRDDKIIAVSANDPVYQDRKKLADLPEHREVIVEGMQERDEGLRILRDGLVMYRQLRRGELATD
ncbi:MAG: inorganic diphosphatase [Deltaproteobacteria bacterium]|nr:inorganic diphosphatase [Deltaproteobacteria bacterium]MBW2547404.1 inorganic diphosphatase [Deltaproteobacteria bacterium]MBW2719559.1 inorganic diphosphatase [Deltaproteobacteria bacterium]